MQLEVGKIYDGKVTGITKFGAFVELEKGTTGMVHISEVAATYVNEIKDFLTEGQQVKVKVLSLGDNGKISLSIKKALPQSEKHSSEKREHGGKNGSHNRQRDSREQKNGSQSHSRQGSQRRSPYREKPQIQDFAKNPPPVYDEASASGDEDFEDMMAKFKASSEERFSDLKHVMDNKRRSTSRRK
ncbi:MAG: S1 RNA-binding domain-containing protein [Ruminococcus sp.]|nr:S1 RNA-binding domain-containing protein [Ruminococcus sp.]